MSAARGRRFDGAAGGGRVARFIDWVDERFPLTAMMKEHVTEYYAAKNFNFWYVFGVLALVVLIIQIVTGIFLTMNYKPSADDAFASVEYIMREVEWGWLIRYMHSTGASMFFIVVYLHMFRGLMYGSRRPGPAACRRGRPAARSPGGPRRVVRCLGQGHLDPGRRYDRLGVRRHRPGRRGGNHRFDRRCRPDRFRRGAILTGSTGGAILTGSTGGAVLTGSTGGAVLTGSTGGAVLTGSTGGAGAAGRTGGAATGSPVGTPIAGSNSGAGDASGDTPVGRLGRAGPGCAGRPHRPAGEPGRSQHGQQRGLDVLAEHVRRDQVQLLHTWGSVDGTASTSRRPRPAGWAPDRSSPSSAAPPRGPPRAAGSGSGCGRWSTAATGRRRGARAPAPGGRRPRRSRSRCRSRSGRGVGAAARSRDSGVRSSRSLPTSSAARCWASAALPPLPATSSRPPRPSSRRARRPTASSRRRRPRYGAASRPARSRCCPRRPCRVESSGARPARPALAATAAYTAASWSATCAPGVAARARSSAAVP